MKVVFEQVEKGLRERHFGVLGTVSREGHPHSTGVVYGVSMRNRPLAIYVTSRNSNRKVRNITANQSVSFVVPLSRRFITFVPPYCIQFQGTAEIVGADDEEATQVFHSSYFLRRIMKAELDIVAKAEAEVCYIVIRPGPVVFTYGVGLSLWKFLRHAYEAGAKVEVPPHRM